MAEFREAIRQFLSLHCVQCDRVLICSECDAPITYVRALLLIHDADQCVTSGDQVWHFPVPYCPRCESKPDANGCVHLLRTQDPKAS